MIVQEKETINTEKMHALQVQATNPHNNIKGSAVKEWIEFKCISSISVATQLFNKTVCSGVKDTNASA